MKAKPLALVALVLAATLAAWFYQPQREAYRLVRSTITLPSGITFSANPAQFAVSPDGQQIAMNLTSAGRAQVWVWRIDGVDSRPLGGTEGVTSVPAWSPDSTSVAFVSGGKLRRIPAAGGPLETLCELGADATVDWGADGTILLASGGAEPIRRVAAAAGDTVRQITRLYPDEQHEFPKFVPGVRRFFFFVRADELRQGVWVGSFDGGMAHRILPSATAATVAGEFIVYALDRLVVAQRFKTDTMELSGVAVPLADTLRVAESTERPAYSVAGGSAPLLVYQNDVDGMLHLTRGWPAMLEGK